MQGALPTLRVPGGLSDALTAPVLAQLTSEQLTAFLLQRRWFGGKGEFRRACESAR